MADLYDIYDQYDLGRYLSDVHTCVEWQLESLRIFGVVGRLTYDDNGGNGFFVFSILHLVNVYIYVCI